jgi:hypothetical protein
VGIAQEYGMSACQLCTSAERRGHMFADHQEGQYLDDGALHRAHGWQRTTEIAFVLFAAAIHTQWLSTATRVAACDAVADGLLKTWSG